MGFGEVLKRAREEANLSQHDLSARSGISQSGIAFIERGERSPSEETMQLLAAALGMELADMLRPAGSEPPHIDLSPSERQLLSYYRQLTPFGQEIALSTMQSFATNPAMLPTKKAASTA